jgi:hypothetical protein
MSTTYPRRNKVQTAAHNTGKTNRIKGIKPSKLNEEDYQKYELAFRLMEVF